MSCFHDHEVTAIYSVSARIAIIVLCAGIGASLIAAGRYFGGTCGFVAVGLLVYGYFRHGTVWLAHRMFRVGKKDRVQSLLDQIAFPNSLGSQSRGFYEMLRGFLACERGELEVAKDHLLRTRSFDLRTTNNRSLVECVLAELSARSGR